MGVAYSTTRSLITARAGLRKLRFSSLTLAPFTRSRRHARDDKTCTREPPNVSVELRKASSSLRSATGANPGENTGCGPVAVRDESLLSKEIW